MLDIDDVLKLLNRKTGHHIYTLVYYGKFPKPDFINDGVYYWNPETLSHHVPRLSKWFLGLADDAQIGTVAVSLLYGIKRERGLKLAIKRGEVPPPDIQRGTVLLWYKRSVL